MSKELFVSSTPHETKVAIVEEDQLAEIYYERENEYTLAGSIYKGRVTRVLPGMQSAFVNIGLERDAFLYVSDFLLDEEEETEGLEQVVSRSRPVVSEPADAPASESTAIEAEDTAIREEEELSEAGPAVSETASEPEPEREGARKWQGRHRRRGRGRFNEREERANEERSSNPVHERTTDEDHAEPARAKGFEPLVLPGESISKYHPNAAAQQEESRPAPPRHVSRPSTEYSLDSAQFSPGSMTLPGESISKYQSGHDAEARIAIAEPSHTAFQPKETEHASQSEIQETEAPPEDARDQNVRLDTQERYQQMNVADVFGGAAVEEEAEKEFEEVEQTEQSEEKQEEADHHSSSEAAHTAPASENQSGPWQAGGSGVVEEEEIDEEESDLPGFEEPVELGEFEELEEEVLGQGHENLVAAGSELTEAVRDAHVNEHATGRYEAEELEEQEESEQEGHQAAGIADEEFEEETEGDSDEDLEGARAEHRASVGTAGYQQQRAGRRSQDRRGNRRPGRRIRGRRPQSARQMPAISDLLKEGQEIVVQIAKEPIAKKGARITSHIALPGRFLVYMPTVHHTGVSRKIASEEERHRLKRIVVSERGEAQGGFIVRTAAAGANEDDLRADIRFLINLWNEIKGRSDKSKAPALIYHDLNLVERILRDQVTSSFSQIWVDTEQEYERILRFVSRFQPSLVKRVKLYSKETPLFEQFSITDEINKALKSKVWLKSGGYIVINQTEALVAIDINTGKYVGKTARLEDTIVKTNIDAIKEIVRQIRLRDLGGIIVIDFIDMDERKNRQKVMQALEEALKADRAPSKVLQFNDFGLVAITRKRVKQSLERTLGQPCTTCQATGMIKSVTTVCNEIYVEMRKMARHFERDIMLRANPEVAKTLKANGGKWLQEMEELTKRTILVKSDPLLHPEQFDIQ
ncbi:MAG TPA: Rne/Rng family ribonuclease [Terriglobales bacterium]|nr:Rne/Rng family ribonuclease [Terriglobales bacterium]